MYEFFLRTFIGSVAQQVIPDLHLNAETFSILGSAYYMAYAVMQIPVGVLTDKLGLKLVLSFATLLCALSTILFAHSYHFVAAFFGRILMGLGSSFAFVCLLVILINWFPRKYFGTLAGVSQFIGTMGPLLGGGPLIALMASYHESWRTALSSIGFVGVLLFVLVIIFVKNKPRGDVQRVVLLEHALPIVQNLRMLFKNKQAWYIAIYSATIYVSISLLGAIWGTQFLQAKGFTQHAAADLISVSWFGYAIGCPLLGYISDRMRRRKPVLLFASLFGIVTTVCMLYLPMETSSLLYGSLFFSLGIVASAQNVGFAIMSEHVDKRSRATALGLNNGVIMLTGAFMPPIVSYFILKSSHGSPHLVLHDFIGALSIMPVLCLISFIVSLFFIRETFCKPQRDTVILKVS